MKVNISALKGFLALLNLYTYRGAANITIGGNKIHSKCVEPAHVSMIELTLKATHGSDMDPNKYYTNVERLLNVIKRIKIPGGKKRFDDSIPETSLYLTIEPKEGVKLDFLLTCDHPSMFFKHTIMTRECDERPDDIKTPTLNHTASVPIDIDRLHHIARIAGNKKEKTEAICIKINEKEQVVASFTNNNDELRSTEITKFTENGGGKLERSPVTWHTDENDEPVVALFSPDILGEITKMLAKKDVGVTEANLWLRKDYPLKLEFTAANGLLTGYIILAPRIESE